MKKLFLLTVAVITANCVLYSQPSAYKGGNHTGIYGVFSNPANIAANEYKWQFNLLSAGAVVANDNVKVGLGDFGDLENRLLDGDEKQLSGIVNLDLIGPSFSYQINSKHAIAFTTRVRGFGNIGTLDTKFAEAITSDDMQSLVYNLSTGNQKVTVNGWSEIGASWGGVLMNKENHCFKAGVTLKFLRGAGNSFVDVQDLRGVITADINSKGNVKPYLTDASGSLYLVSSGVDMFNDDISVSDFTKSNGTGVGFDIGFTYEYRETSDSEKDSFGIKNNQYKFKVGLALLDIGSLSYNSTDGSAYHYTLNIPKGQKLYLRELDGSIKSMQNYLAKSPYAKKKSISESYKPSLPTTLNFMVDYYWGYDFFTEFSGQISLIDKDKKVENAYYYNGFTLTPRYEMESIGIALPINYNSISDLNAGLTLRMGPLMVGSGSIITALLSEHKQADLFIGLRFGF